MNVNTEREVLIGFITTTCRFHAKTRGESSAVLDGLEKVNWARARITGLRQAARDVVEMRVDLKCGLLSDLDTQLASSDLPTLTAMRDAAYRRVARVILRGEIRSDTEWYLLNGVVSNLSGSPLSAHERQVGERLLGIYVPRDEKGEA